MEELGKAGARDLASVVVVVGGVVVGGGGGGLALAGRAEDGPEQPLGALRAVCQVVVASQSASHRALPGGGGQSSPHIIIRSFVTLVHTHAVSVRWMSTPHPPTQTVVPSRDTQQMCLS